jgi:FkbM family methyltransferase
VTELEKFFVSLVRIGFKPLHIVDVGANRGGWTRLALHYFPDAHFTLLEPNPAMASHLEGLVASNPRIHYEPVGAGAEPGELPFTINRRDDSCTFSMSAEQAAAAGFHQVALPIVTLDSLLEASELPPPAMIKIDAEGFDLEVLRGAVNSLRSCEVVLVEAGVLNRNFSNDLRSVIDALARLGFRPVDVTDINRTQRHGSLWLVEMAFAKQGGLIESSVTSYD